MKSKYFYMAELNSASTKKKTPNVDAEDAKG